MSDALIESIAKAIDQSDNAVGGERHREYWHDLARAAIAAIEAAGYRIVPVVATEEMVGRGGAAYDHPNVFMGGPSYAGKRTAKKLYVAMLAAAPKVIG